MRNQKTIAKSSPPQISNPLDSKSKRGGHLTPKCPAFYIKTFGWPMVQVPRDDFRDFKEGKCFGMMGLSKVSLKTEILAMLHDGE